MRKANVLITGLGAPGAPGIIKSLRLNGEREIKIVGVDADVTTAIGQGLVDASYSVPLADDETFIDSIIDICKREEIEVVIPLVTKELFKFAKDRDSLLDDGITVQVSSYEKLNIANNKYKLFEFCKNNDIPVPEFFLVKTLDEFIKYSSELGYPDRTICFKPPISNGLRGFRIIQNDQNRMDNLINEKPNNIFIDYNEFIKIAEDSDYFPDLLLMEYLPGKEYSVDALINEGCFHKAIPRTRDKIKMGISFVGTTVEHHEIISITKKITEGLGLNGNIGLQFKDDINGKPKIIECNPRVQGTIILCTAAGYNMVYNNVKAGLGEKLIEYDIKWGTKMIRYWDEIFFLDNESFRL